MIEVVLGVIGLFVVLLVGSIRSYSLGSMDIHDQLPNPIQYQMRFGWWNYDDE